MASRLAAHKGEGVCARTERPTVNRRPSIFKPNGWELVSTSWSWSSLRRSAHLAAPRPHRLASLPLPPQCLASNLPLPPPRAMALTLESTEHRESSSPLSSSGSPTTTTTTCFVLLSKRRRWPGVLRVNVSAFSLVALVICSGLGRPSLSSHRSRFSGIQGDVRGVELGEQGECLG